MVGGFLLPPTDLHKKPSKIVDNFTKQIYIADMAQS